jgi:hypothetical protein
MRTAAWPLRKERGGRAALTLALLYALLTVGMPFWHTCGQGGPSDSASPLKGQTAAASDDGSHSRASILGRMSFPLRPCLACAWGRTTPTAFLFPLAFGLCLALTCRVRPLSEGRPAFRFTPSFRTRAPPVGW